MKLMAYFCRFGKGDFDHFLDSWMSKHCNCTLTDNVIVLGIFEGNYTTTAASVT